MEEDQMKDTKGSKWY